MGTVSVRMQFRKSILQELETAMATTGQNPPTTSGETTHRFVEANGIRIHLAEQGTGPLVLLCHGFPELWSAWHYQLSALAEAGYHAVAPDLRGYGQTSRPDEVEHYTLLHLVGDLVGILDALGEERSILVGHDWGGVLAWQAALTRPDRFGALVSMSSPYLPRGPLSGTRSTLPPTQAWKENWGNQFFYQAALLQPGRAQAELGGDVRTSLRRLLYGASGDAEPSQRWHPILPDPTASLLNSAGNPASLPAWLSEDELDYCAGEFERTGFEAAINWYRNSDRNWELLAAYSGAKVTQPTLFLFGEQDPLLEIPGAQRAIERMPQYVPRLRTIGLPGCGHWIGQERAAQVNQAMLEFLTAVGDLC
jgi:pimeloyl-ACP methyl ester carboxylesterase